MRFLHGRYLGMLLCLLLAACGDGDDSPTIQSFSAASSEVEEGESTTLSAVFANGTGDIDQGVGAVQSGTAKTVSPAADTVYTLTVSADGRAATASTTVRIFYVELWDFSQPAGWLLEAQAGDPDSGSSASAVIDAGRLQLSSSQGFDGLCTTATARRDFGDAKLRDGRYASVAVSFLVAAASGTGMGYPYLKVTYGGKQVKTLVPDATRTVRIEWADDKISVLVDGVAWAATSFSVTDSAAAPVIEVLANACAPDLASASIDLDSIEVTAR